MQNGSMIDWPITAMDTMHRKGSRSVMTKCASGNTSAKAAMCNADLWSFQHQEPVRADGVLPQQDLHDMCGSARTRVWESSSVRNRRHCGMHMLAA